MAADDGPSGVAVSPDGGSVYVTNHFSNTVSQFDVGVDGTLQPKSPAMVAAGDGPAGVAASPDGSLASLSPTSAPTASRSST